MVAGFTSGIGVIIILLQFSVLAGSATIGGSAFSVFRDFPENTVLDPQDLAIGAVALAICVAWPRRLRGFAPASLVALLIGIGMAIIWLDGASRIGELSAQLPALSPPVLTSSFLMSAIQPALTLALIGSVNSLVTSLVADSLTRGRHQSNRELAGQGIR